MAGAGGNPAAPLASPRSGIISPGFRSVAALAGWDEEAILACLVVQDTPVQEPSTRKKRFRKSKTPTTDSSRKKRARTRGPPSPIPAVVLCLDEAENSNEENQDLPETAKIETKDREKDEIKEQPSSLEVKKESSSASSLPSMDRLKEELSCAICLDICYEPSTTPCGHSFCLNCLKCAASRCGKRCPKCRQLISNGRSCTINTVLWNTIQLLFPQEVEARKKAAEAAASSPTGNGSKRKRNSFPGTGSGGVGDNITSSGGTVATSSTHNPPTTNASTEFWASRGTTRSNNTSAFILSSELVNRAELERARRVSVIGRGHGSSSSTSRPQTGAGGGSLSGSGGTRRLRRREAATPNQSDDLALALRLQREEFLGAIGHGSNRPQQQQPQPQFLGVQLARANLRALAARAVRTSTRNTTSP